MRVNTFKLERIQSEWEHKVRYNPSESGVHPVSVKDLLTPAEFSTLPELCLGYSQTNGTEELRNKISLLYRGADRDSILVTNGTAEAKRELSMRSCAEGQGLHCPLVVSVV